VKKRKRKKRKEKKYEKKREQATLKYKLQVTRCELQKTVYSIEYRVYSEEKTKKEIDAG